MAMNLDSVGADNGFGVASWDHRDAIIYALGVGAGQDDPAQELHFTTENSMGVQQQVLPVFGVVQASYNSVRASLGDFHLSKVLHGEQGFVVHKPLPPEGKANASFVVKGIYDKGKAALAVSETTLSDPATGEPWITGTGSLFIKGEGGFGGPNAPAIEWEAPTRPADRQITSQTRTDQALLYRLSGDRNPLHSDPAFAAKAGFDRPILHGMCTYGITCRLLISALCDGDATRVRSMFGRFSKPVMPGAKLTVDIWVDGTKAQFVTRDDAGDIVLDKGTFEFGESA